MKSAQPRAPFIRAESVRTRREDRSGYGGAGLILTQVLFGHASVRELPASAYAMALFHGVVLFFFGTLLWYETIRRLDLSRATAIVTPCEPVVSLLLVWMLLRTLPNVYQAMGLLLLAPGM